MLKEIYRQLKIGFIFIPVVFIAACQGLRQTSITMWLQPDTPTLVSFPLTASSQIYTFTANPAASTQIMLYPMTDNLPYSAEVHDNRGATIASFGSGLRNAVLTIGPGNGLYEVAIKSENNDQQGMLSVRVGSLAEEKPLSAASYTAPAVDVTDLNANLTAYTDTQCSARSGSGSNVNIRSAPGLSYPVIGSLAAGTSIVVTHYTADNWFAVKVNNQIGWISGSVITVGGTCNNLPLVASPVSVPTAIPTIIPSPNTFYLTVDRDSSGDFSDNLSYDENDLIQISVENLSSAFDSSYREFTLTLICSGIGVEHVRWGVPENPALECGHSFVMPFTPYYSQQTIAVRLQDNNQQDAVAYTLLAAKH